MQSTSYVSISQQTVLSRTMDMIANNLANSSTTGFKEQQPMFRQFLVNASNGQQVSYVQEAGSFRDASQGDLSLTGNPLDVGINGPGYFTIGTQNGDRYTRNGKFQLGKNRELQTSTGDAVQSTQKRSIVIPQNVTQIRFTNDGTVMDQNGLTIAKLAIANFKNPSKLVSSAGGLYVTDETPTQDTKSTIQQGMVENSNVKPIVELTRLLNLQQFYSNDQQMVTDEDSRIRNAIDKLSQAV
jgi:flagellar basal-body rod protein FlgF